MGNVFSDRYSNLGPYDVPPPPQPLFGFGSSQFVLVIVYFVLVVISLIALVDLHENPDDGFFWLKVTMPFASVILWFVWLKATDYMMENHLADEEEYKDLVEQVSRIRP